MYRCADPLPRRNEAVMVALAMVAPVWSMVIVVMAACEGAEVLVRIRHWGHGWSALPGTRGLRWPHPMFIVLFCLHSNKHPAYTCIEGERNGRRE